MHENFHGKKIRNFFFLSAVSIVFFFIFIFYKNIRIQKNVYVYKKLKGKMEENKNVRKGIYIFLFSYT